MIVEQLYDVETIDGKVLLRDVYFQTHETKNDVIRYLKYKGLLKGKEKVIFNKERHKIIIK